MQSEGKSYNSIISPPSWQHKTENIKELSLQGCAVVIVNSIVYTKEEEKRN